MMRQLSIAGKNSDDIYTLLYPNNIINFCRYDFSVFMDHCTDLCRLAARSGEYNIDDVYSIRNSISGCHKYYEQNMRTIFEKIVVDCWIEYLCKQSDISVNSLWQSFMKCRTPFETAIFTRLSDYRYNRAINQWTNLIKMQEYARTKVDFVFGVTIRSSAQALARLNYFDLLFNVAANEQGFPIDEIAPTGVYSSGRLPNSPFVMGTAAKEILRNQLKDMEYRDTPYKSRKNPDLTDKTAMDAFAAIKDYIPDRNDSMAKTIIKSMTTVPNYIYMPGSFKAVIDIELDATAQGTAFIQKCARCGDYYIRDEKYDYDYCSRPQKEGPTCLELLGGSESEGVVLSKEYMDDPDAEEEISDDDDDLKIIYVDKEVVDEKMNVLYKEMAARVNVDMTQRDFSRWFQQEIRLKERIMHGEAGERELNKFIELSRGDAFATKKSEPAPVPEKTQVTEETEEVIEDGRTVRKFVFEKVERTQQPEKKSEPTLAESEKAALEAVRRLFGVDAVYPPPPPVQEPLPQMQPPVSQAQAIPQPLPQPAASPVFMPLQPKTVDENVNIIPVMQPAQSADDRDTARKADLKAIEQLKEKAKMKNIQQPAAPAATATAPKAAETLQSVQVSPQPAQPVQPAVQPVQPVQPAVQPAQPVQPAVQPMPQIQPVAQPIQIQQVQPMQQTYAAYPAMPGVYPQPQQGYAYPAPAAQYPSYYQQPIRVQPSPSKVIRGVVPQQAEPAAVLIKPKTVVIPTGSTQARRFGQQQDSDGQYSAVNQGIQSGGRPETDPHIRDHFMAATQTFPRLSPAADHLSVKMAESVFKPEPDVKLFTPKKKGAPSPYEKLKQPLKEYDKNQRSGRSAVQEQEEPVYEEPAEQNEKEKEEIRTAASRESASRPAYGAISAYKTIAGETPAAQNESFSGILDGIERDDGFEKDEGLVDSDGLPISHKTKRVMKAVFGPTQASPFVTVNLPGNKPGSQGGV